MIGKKRLFILICFAAFLMVMTTGCQKEGESSEGAAVSKETEMKVLLEDFRAQADDRVKNASKPQAADAVPSASAQKAKFPSSFDLRSVDTDGDGKAENYVTGVKQQRPFGSCWSFATMAAAETSILYEMGKESVVKEKDGSRHDAIDLSEHHLAWFAYTPLADDGGETQAGEGLYSQVEGLADNPSLRMGSGSTQFAASTLFACGIGPLAEPDFDASDSKDSDLCYRSKEGNIVYNESRACYNYSEEDDWSVDESQRFRQSYMLEDSYFLPSPVKFDSEKNYDMEYANSVVATYKEQITSGRPVSISYCADVYRPDQEDGFAQYINSDDGSWAHYCYEPAGANHAVTIVGWDDDYPAKNFLSEVRETDEEGKGLTNEDGTPKIKTVSQPPGNGAWIVKNSWGAENSVSQGQVEGNWGYEGSGYFYLSYYDQSISTAECFDFDVDNKLKKELGKYMLEEHDYMPCEMPFAVKTTSPVKTANAFVAEEAGDIKAISCITASHDETASFDIYVMDGDTFDPSEKNLVCSFTKEFPNSGLHVVSTPEAIKIDKGQMFVVSLTQKTEDSPVISIAGEFNQKGFDAGYCFDSYAAKAVVNPGESYVFLPESGTWVDMSEILASLEGEGGSFEYLAYDNFPIKAYASLR